MKKVALCIVLIFIALGVIHSGVLKVQDALIPTPQEYLDRHRGACVESFVKTIDYDLTVEEMCDASNGVEYLKKYKGKLTEEEDLFFFE